MGRNASLVIFDSHLKMEEQFKSAFSLHAYVLANIIGRAPPRFMSVDWDYPMWARVGCLRIALITSPRVHFSSAIAIKSSLSQPSAFRIIDPYP